VNKRRIKEWNEEEELRLEIRCKKMYRTRVIKYIQEEKIQRVKVKK